MRHFRCFNLFFAALFLAGATMSDAGSLIDVAFTTASITSKMGLAATGLTVSDFWNTCTASRTVGIVTNLSFVDGSASGATLMLTDDGVGDYGNGASDPMYGNYLYTQGANMNVTVTALPAGTYNVYLYGHGNEDYQYGVFQLSVDLQTYGSEQTTNGSGWLSSAWQDGVQYVEFTNVSVFEGQTINITVMPGGFGFSVLSGLQMANIANNPFIVSQPTNATAIDDSNASFNVVAGGPPPFAYQWQFNGANLTWATNATLLLSNIQPPGSGSYTVLVSNTYGSILSGAGVLATVPQMITDQPQPASQSAVVGQSISYSVGVATVAPVSYQWQFDGTNLPGATNATLLLSNITASESGSYEVLVSNMYGSTLSAPAVLTILPEIIAAQPQPASQTAPIGQNISYNVVVTTVAPVSYQWQFDGTNMVGATNATLGLTNVVPLNAGSYAVLVSNAFGTTLSATAALTVVADSISTQSSNPSLYDAFLFASTTMLPPATAVWFQWGTNTNYGAVTPPIILQSSASSVSNLIVGLTPYTTYHYQAVASNIYGMYFGGDVVFTNVPRFVRVATNTNWFSCVMSGDGHELVATSNGIICITTNFGLTFMPTPQTGSAFAVSPNGSTILALSGSNLYASLDRGTTWTTNTTPVAFDLASASSTGQVIVATDGSTNVFASTNFGATWSESSLSEGPSCLTCSPDGSHFFAGAYIVGPGGGIDWVYASANSGKSWSTLEDIQTSGMHSAGVSSISCSANGSIIAAACEYPLISENGGASWTNNSSSGFLNFASISLSANGQVMLADLVSPGDGPIEISPNAGTNWYFANAPDGADTVSSSADGNTLAAFIGEAGVIYLSLPPPSVPTSLSVAPSVSNGSLIFQVSGQAGYTYVIQASTDLVNWSSIATLVNTNGVVSFTDAASTNFPQRFYLAFAP